MKEKILAALIAAGLSEGLFPLIKVEKEEEIEGAVDILKKYLPKVESQSEIDRRVTGAVKTAIENYEKKYSLKEGKVTETEEEKLKRLAEGKEAELKKNGEGKENPQFAELMKVIAEMSGTIKGLQEKSALEKRQVHINKSLSDAKIPESMQKRFSINNDATEEEIGTAVTEYKQELIDLGISGMIEPGKGGSGLDVGEKNAKIAAETRNNSKVVTDSVPAKEL